MNHFPISNGFSQGALRHLVNNYQQSSVLLTSSGVYDSSFPPTNLFTFSSYFVSESKSNFGQWLQMEFKDHKLDLEGYSLYSLSDARPRSWTFSVSIDGNSWSVTDFQQDQNINTGKTYESFSQGIRFFRWTCHSVSGSQFMQIRHIDVFGILMPFNYTSTLPSLTLISDKCSNFCTFTFDFSPLSLAFIISLS